MTDKHRAHQPKEFKVPGDPPSPYDNPSRPTPGDAAGGGLLGMGLGGCAGLGIGVVLCALGGLACLTGVGALLGIPMILAGVALPSILMTMGGLGGVQGSGYEFSQHAQKVIHVLLLGAMLGLILWTVFG